MMRRRKVSEQQLKLKIISIPQLPVLQQPSIPQSPISQPPIAAPYKDYPLMPQQAYPPMPPMAAPYEEHPPMPQQAYQPQQAKMESPSTSMTPQEYPPMPQPLMAAPYEEHPPMRQQAPPLTAGPYGEYTPLAQPCYQPQSPFAAPLMARPLAYAPQHANIGFPSASMSTTHTGSVAERIRVLIVHTALV